MIPVTAAFIAAVCGLIAGVLYVLRRMARNTDTIYRESLLEDAANAISYEDRTILEAEAVTFASTGWDMPDFTQHQAAAKALVEAYDLEQEMAADLDSAIETVEGWDA